MGKAQRASRALRAFKCLTSTVSARRDGAREAGWRADLTSPATGRYLLLHDGTVEATVTVSPQTGLTSITLA